MNLKYDKYAIIAQKDTIMDDKISYNGLGSGNSKYLNRNYSPVSRNRDGLTLPVGISIDGDYVIDNSVIQEGSGHLQDGIEGNSLQGKLPYHPTFSNESPYASKLGTNPHWENNNGRDVYYPTQEQMQRDGYIAELQDYYKREKGKGIDKIIVPAPYADIVK